MYCCVICLWMEISYKYKLNCSTQVNTVQTQLHQCACYIFSQISRIIKFMMFCSCNKSSVNPLKPYFSCVINCNRSSTCTSIISFLKPDTVYQTLGFSMWPVAIFLEPMELKCLLRIWDLSNIGFISPNRFAAQLIHLSFHSVPSTIRCKPQSANYQQKATPPFLTCSKWQVDKMFSPKRNLSALASAHKCQNNSVLLCPYIHFTATSR